ncbi:MAG: anaerobic ribonucleoside-triphosphate reductase activating protein [Vicinamibacteria bacterium]|nr:anaerobic ribonucleoside-triphosphate reductase activating protein [Vicinamibacteria bacterium]
MIGGFQPCSFIDFPGRLAAVVFTQGCNLRCRYCHNPELLPLSCPGGVNIADVLRFLDSRRDKLTGVVVSGGEPTLHDDLPDLLCSIRQRGFAVKLDTNGTRPSVVRRIVDRRLVDFVAVDVKAPPGASSRWLCGAECQGENALATLEALVHARVAHEARTTVVRERHSVADLTTIAEALVSVGAQSWRLQPVRQVQLDARAHPLAPPANETLARALEAGHKLGLDVSVRGSAMPFLSWHANSRAASSDVAASPAPKA